MSDDRMDSSIPALVKRGFIGLMQIGEIDGLVIAWREVNVAQHLSAVGTFALDANCEGGTLTLPTQDSAKTKRRVDLVSGYRHPCRIRPITRARRVFRVRSGSRLLRAPVLRTSRALQCTTSWPQSSFFTVCLDGFH